ncbi:hypothetical protein ACFLQU_00985 [Verrucomicrobiota bacterium]
MTAKKASGRKKNRQTKARRRSTPPSHPKNPFRKGSGYSILVDLIARSPMTRGEILKKYAAITGTEERLGKYSLAVICSARKSLNSKRHTSARKGYFISEDKDGKLVAHFSNKK